MDITNKFVVAECYDQDGSIFIEAAPFTWFRDNYMCWPKSQKNQRLRCVLGAKVNLDEPGEWTPCLIKSVKGLFESFPDACQTAASLVTFVDTEEEESNHIALSKKRTLFRQKESEVIQIDELESMMLAAVEPQQSSCSVAGENFSNQAACNETLDVYENCENQIPSCVTLPNEIQLSQYLTASNDNSTCK